MAMAFSDVKNNIAMALAQQRRIRRMPAHKGDIPLRYREHVCAVARRAILDLKAQGLSETAIGKRWGLSQATVNALKSGTASKIGLRTLLQLRAALHMSIDELLGLPPIEGNSLPPHSEGRAQRR